MTAADPEETRRLQGYFRFSHQLSRFAALSLLLATPSWFGMATLSAYLWLPCIAATLAMFACLAHTALPPAQCQRCEREMPDDPQAAVERHAWMLWFSHRLDARPLVTWACLVAAVIGVNLAVWVTDVSLLYAPVDITIVFMCLSTWRHHFLAAWCPYCHGGGWDGDHERIPDPDPVGQGTR